MPKFWQRKGRCEGKQSPWFVKISNRTPPPPNYTFQLRPAGIKILRGMGLQSGESFEKHQFETLQELGLTYTLDKGSKAQVIGDITEEAAKDIPPAQRVAFVKEVLDEYSVAELQAEGFYRVLQSIEQGPQDHRTEALEYLLQETTIALSFPDGLAAESDPVFSSSILGALVCRAFHEYWTTYSGVVEGDYWPIGYKRGWMYVLVEETAWDIVPGISEFSLDLPEFFVAEGLPSGSYQGWEGDVISIIHSSQFLGDIINNSSRVGQAIFDGLSSIQNVVMLPQDALADASVDALFTQE